MKYAGRGWILWRPDPSLVKQERYEIDRLLEAAPEHAYQVEVVNPNELELLVNSEKKDGIYINGEEAPLPDFVIPRMGSTSDYFSLAALRQLENLGVYCLNNATAVTLAQDKLLHLQVLARAGAAVPKTLLIRFPVDADLVDREIGFPVVVKTLIGTQGSGVHLCDDRQSLTDLLQFVEANNPDAQLVLQQFLAESRGRDVRVLSVGGHIVAAMERIAKTGFKSNYSLGGEARRFEYGPRNELSVAEVMRNLDMDIAGLDFLYDEEVGFRICEVNSSPGFEGLEATCGVDVPAFIYQYLDVKFRISSKVKARMLDQLNKPAMKKKKGSQRKR
jgi:gamma-F420-2:alpha-L-glutamate ligase